MSYLRKMSQGDGHLIVSGTRIEVLGYTKQNVIISLCMAVFNPFPLWRRTSRVYQDHLRFPVGVSLPSFRLPITRVSA